MANEDPWRKWLELRDWERECMKNALDAFHARMGLIQSRFAHSQQQGHVASTPAHTITGHTPPTTTNVSDDTPPPPPSPHRHSHTWGVAHKRVTQPSQPAHATTPERPQRRAATPKAEEDTQGTPGHVASRPQGPSVVLTRTMATRPKRRPTVQHRCNGVKVCRHPPRSWGTRPLLLTPCVQREPSCSAEARNTDRVERPGSDPPKATTEYHDDRVGDQTAPRASPHTTIHWAQRPWRCAQARDVNCQPHVRCDPPMATPTRCRCGEDDRTAPMAPPHTTVYRAQRPWRCAQARSADRPMPNRARRNHQRPPQRATTTAIRGSQRHPP